MRVHKRNERMPRLAGSQHAKEGVKRMARNRTISYGTRVYLAGRAATLDGAAAPSGQYGMQLPISEIWEARGTSTPHT